MKNSCCCRIIAAVLFCGLSLRCQASGIAVVDAQTLPPSIATQLDACNVAWDVPGPTSAESMPIGNGDIGLNVWVDLDGTLNFYIGKADAWSERNVASEGLLKLGQVQISLSPNPMTAGSPFLQLLKLREGVIEVQYGNLGSIACFQVWVDANNPVIHVEATSAQPLKMTVHFNTWRTAPKYGISADTILPVQNQIGWYHRNPAGADPHLRHITFGGMIKGDNLVGKDETTLISSKPAAVQMVSIYALTATTATANDWLTQINRKIMEVETIPLKVAFAAHENWWERFWNKSWIFVRGDDVAKSVTVGYTLQRFISACGGRGACPIKFNGSIFVVDNPNFNNDHRTSVSPDYRAWGGQYWFQNTRLIYWPMLMAGDFDLMQPLFKMYTTQIASNAIQVENYYHHAGSYFAETAPFYGGLKFAGPDVQGNATLHYFTPILELSMLMLDFYEYTGDEQFAKKTLVPTAMTGLVFFNEHFGTDADGKLLLAPDNSIETFHKANDPAPDIAGLTAVTRRLLSLPIGIVSSADREKLLAFQKIIPPLPIGQRDGKTVLLPYTAPPVTARVGPENPELYAVFPFRLYGVGKAGYGTAVNSFKIRQSPAKGGWSQDPIQAAILGLAQIAKSNVAFDFTNKDPLQKFPAFWASQQDYTPNQCNGGSAEEGLQNMLMQADGHTIWLLPAWPKGWEGDFKLHAPGPTTVQGSIRNGKVVNLIITPSTNILHLVDHFSPDQQPTNDVP